MLSDEFGYWLQQFINACTLASFYVPLAVAFALVQGITNEIFLSFGDFAMYAAMAAIYAGLTGLLAGNNTAVILAMSLVLAVLSSSALGHFAATHVFAPLIGHTSQAFMIGSIGVSIALQEVMRLHGGARDLWMMPLFDGMALRIFDGTFPVQIGIMQLIAMAVAVVAIGTVFFILRFTASGRYWKACSQSERLAKLSGVDMLTVLRWSCVGSAALASVSGWIIAVSYGGVTFSMGLMLGFKAMLASVIGGFGTVSGAIVGGVFLAFAETLWTAVFLLAYRDVAVFGFIILILVLKPEGLYGSTTRRERED